MAQVRVEFKLSMPHAGSWNRQWSSAGRNFTVTRRMSELSASRLGIPRSWRHAWDDGWCAAIDARVMGKGERSEKSHGFCGYEWMVDSIIRCGKIQYSDTD